LVRHFLGPSFSGPAFSGEPYKDAVQRKWLIDCLHLFIQKPVDMQLKDECRHDGISNVRLMLNSQADDAEKAVHCYEVW